MTERRRVLTRDGAVFEVPSSMVDADAAQATPYRTDDETARAEDIARASEPLSAPPSESPAETSGPFGPMLIVLRPFAAAVLCLSLPFTVPACDVGASGTVGFPWPHYSWGSSHGSGEDSPSAGERDVAVAVGATIVLEMIGAAIDNGVPAQALASTVLRGSGGAVLALGAGWVVALVSSIVALFPVAGLLALPGYLVVAVFLVLGIPIGAVASIVTSVIRARAHRARIRAGPRT